MTGLTSQRSAVATQLLHAVFKLSFMRILVARGARAVVEVIHLGRLRIELLALFVTVAASHRLMAPR